MIAPMCVGCHREKVKRKSNRNPPGPRGLRTIEGITWNWFCSHGCAGRATNNLAVSEGRLKRWRQRAQRLAEQLRTLADPDGRVELAKAAKLILERESAAYKRGAHAAYMGYQRRRLKGAA